MRKLLFLSLLLVAVTGLASADTIIYTFSWSGGSQGTIAPGGLSGSGIGIDSLDVFDMTTSVENTYAITGGLLSYNLGSDTVSITGNAGAFGSGTLLSASLNSSGGWSHTPCSNIDTVCDVNFIKGTSNLGTFDSSVMGGGYTDGKSTGGAPWNAYSNYFQTMQITAAPEPGSLALLASGLLFVGGSLRRKLTRQ